MIWKETWCVDIQKKSLQNNENGLYAKKVYISSGGAGPVVLVNSKQEGIWNFLEIQGKNDIYNIVMVQALHGNTFALCHGMKNSYETYVGYCRYDPNDSYQQWKIF